jgi:predicted metal-dependent phosphoesterase TrpH
MDSRMTAKTVARGDVRRSVADLHIHTHYSDGWDSPAEIVDQARLRGLRVIAITDHDCIEGAFIAARHAAMKPGVDVVVGEEVSTREGHVLGLFLKTRVAPGLTAADTVAAIHDQGGLAIAAHPYWRTRAHASGHPPHGVGDRLLNARFDAVEVLNGGFTPSMMLANVRAAWANEHRLLAEIGGSDAHVKQAVGSAVTLFRGSTVRHLRRALESGETLARVRWPSAVAIGRYVAWGLTARPVPARQAG